MADEMRQILKERFEKQDVDEGFYDVTFKIGDKVLHAHRFLLTSISKPFQAMFSDKWKKTSDPIEIKTCSFEPFKQFIAFFYHGTNNFNEADIFDIIDLAEMYQVQPLKNQLDLFLYKLSFTDENIYQLLEISEVYGFPKLKNSLSNYLVANWKSLFERDDFLGVGENVLMGILGVDRDGNEEIENALFEKIFAWTEKKVKEKNANNFDSLKLEEQQALLKIEMAPFLTKFKFGLRSMEFLNDFVAARSYLFDDWEGFLEAAQNNMDDIDNAEKAYYQKFQILPYHFNNRYHQVLRGITYSQSLEAIDELNEFIQNLPNENGAYKTPGESHINCRLLRKLEYDGSSELCLGFHCSSRMTIINTNIFSINQSLMDVYDTVCDLDDDNFPTVDETEDYFCIQLL